VNCRGTGHDGELQAGATWPEPRFELHDKLVLDRLTGLIWPAHADLADFPLSWPEALEFVDQLNHEEFLGHVDWRLPNRAELRSLLSHHSKSPVLPQDHPFQGVALTWYWTSTSAAINPAYAWHVHMGGARMFYGRKDQYFLVWPVRAGDSTIPKPCRAPARQHATTSRVGPFHVPTAARMRTSPLALPGRHPASQRRVRWFATSSPA